MKTRTTISLVIIAIATTLLVQWLEGHRLSRVYYDEDHPIIDLIDSIVWLEVEHGADRFVLDKIGEDWVLVDPMRYPADDSLVQQLVTQLREFQVEGKGNAEQLADYGLVTPRLTIRWKNIRGGEESWQFGNVAPGGNLVYTLFRGQVVLCRRTLSERFERLSLDDLRSATIVGISSYAAGLLTISASDSLVKLERKAADWWLVEPKRMLADAEEVRSVTDKLNEWTIRRFAPGTPRDLGLDPPRLTVEVADPAKGVAVKLLIGNEFTDSATGDSLVYLRHADAPEIFCADAAPLAWLRRPAEIYRSRALFHLSSIEIASLEIKSGSARDSSLVFPNQDGTYRIVHGSQVYPADDGEVVALLQALRAERVESFIAADRQQLQNYGLDTPLLFLEAMPGAGEREQLYIGGEVPGTDGLRYVWNKRWAEEFATVHLTALGDLLLQAPYSLRSRVVLQIAGNPALQLQVSTSDGRVFDFDRLPQGSWMRRGGGDGAVEELSLLFETLRNLRAQAWLDPATAEIGPTHYALRLSLQPPMPDAGFPPREFFIGPLEGNRTRLVREGAEGWIFRYLPDAGPDVFAVLQSFLDDLTK